MVLVVPSETIHPPQFDKGKDISTNAPQASEVPFKVQVEQTISKMRAPPLTQPVSKARTLTPTIPIQLMAIGGLLLS